MQVGMGPDKSRATEVSDKDIVAGNVYDKYNTRNLLYRRLVSGYFDRLTDLLGRTHPAAVLEVGCGEGHMADFARRSGVKGLFSLDISRTVLAEAVPSYPQVRFVCGDAYRLPFRDRQFDLVLALESLEHMSHAERALEEIRRVSNRDVIVSVPRTCLAHSQSCSRGLPSRPRQHTRSCPALESSWDHTHA